MPATTRGLFLRRRQRVLRCGVVMCAMMNAGCGLLDPTEWAALRISLACGVERNDVVTALTFVEESSEFAETGTGNIASLLDAIPALEVIASNARCLDAFLDAVEQLRRSTLSVRTKWASHVKRAPG